MNENIQWFPGHMQKARRQITAVLPFVDVVAELIDARIPFSSRNPVLREIISDKPVVMLLNKADLADRNLTKQWISYFKENEKCRLVLDIDSKSGAGLQQFIDMTENVMSTEMERFAQKGMTGRTLRIMVIGVPNVGKSSLINRLAGKSRAKTEDRAGVTRKNQWYSVSKAAELLDTPGVLWPKFEDETIGENLAFIGSIKDTVIDTQLLAEKLLLRLCKYYPDMILSRYKLDTDLINVHKVDIKHNDIDFSTIYEYKLLEAVAKKRGMLISKGEFDLQRAADMVLDEFRAGKIGRISLEKPGSILN